MDAFKPFIPDGHKLLEAVRGELGGPGKPGAVLVIDPPRTGAEKLGEGPSRLVLLLLDDGSGTMKEVARNSHIVPCAMCGGIAGDPYAYARVESGRVLIAVGGGSRERWSDEYAFVYEAGANRFIVDRVERTVTDTQTDRQQSVTQESDQLGLITFNDFDPAQLGDLPMLDDGSN